MKVNYAYKASLYAEQYGIVEYKVVKNTMVYYKSFPAYLNQPHYSIRFTVNLDTLECKSEQCKKYVSSGVHNVY